MKCEELTFEDIVTCIDRYLGEKFTWYIDDCIYGKKAEDQVFDVANTFNCNAEDLEKHKAFLKKRSGLYLFILKEDFKMTEKLISSYKSVRGAPLRFYSEKELLKNEIFYVGSKYDDLYTRIKQQIFGTGKSSSLKLFTKERKFLADKLKVVAIPLKQDEEALLRKEEMTKTFLLLTENNIHKFFDTYAGTAR